MKIFVLLLTILACSALEARTRDHWRPKRPEFTRIRYIGTDLDGCAVYFDKVLNPKSDFYRWTRIGAYKNNIDGELVFWHELNDNEMISE